MRTGTGLVWQDLSSRIPSPHVISSPGFPFAAPLKPVVRDKISVGGICLQPHLAGWAGWTGNTMKDYLGFEVNLNEPETVPV